MMEKSGKIYVAGHTGMVGSAIVRRLKEEGYNNIICLTLEELDLTNQKAVTDFFKAERPDYVVLAAAKVGGIQANNTYRAQIIYENLMIQNNVIHQSYVSGVKKLLFLGSSCIYPKNAPQPLKEEYLLTGELEQTNEPYAIAKIAGIKLCESYYRQYGCNFISVMPTNLYGPNDNYNLETSHVMPALIRKMHLAKCLEHRDWTALRHDLDKRPVAGIDQKSSEEEIIGVLTMFGITSDKENQNKVTVTLWGTGKVYREFMHVDDMASACIKIMEEVDVSRLAASGSLFMNIGTGVDQTILNLALLVQKVIGFRGEIRFDNIRAAGSSRKLLDISALKELGFKSGIGIEEGIRRVYEDYSG